MLFDKKNHTIAPDGPRAVIERGMGKYEIDTTLYGADLDDAARLIKIKNKIVQLLHDEGCTYMDAMQIPALLKTDLSLSFQDDMLKTLVHPLSGGAKQGDDGNHDCNDGQPG